MRTSTERVRYLYFNWLLEERIRAFGNGMSYWMLCTVLYGMSYYWTIWQDDARVVDALKLREEFAKENPELGEHDDILQELPKQVSVLEVMVALAVRLERDMMTSTRYSDRTWMWFNYMLVNANLSMYDDVRLTSHPDLDGEARLKVSDILEHRYDEDGYGSFFPLEHHKNDCRGMTLWEQACSWLIENREKIVEDSDLATAQIAEMI